MTFLPIEPASVTEDDVDVIIAKFCATDGQARTQDDFDVWWIAAQANGWTRAECAAGMVRVMSTFSGFRIMPAHLTDAITEMRRVVGKAWNPPDPPRELRDEPAREIAWRRGAAADFRNRALLALASGAALDTVPMISPRFAGRPELPPAAADSPAAVAARAALAEHEQRVAIPSVPTTTAVPVAARRVRLDPRRLEDVRDELARRQPVPVPVPEVDEAVTSTPQSG